MHSAPNDWKSLGISDEALKQKKIIVRDLAKIENFINEKNESKSLADLAFVYLGHRIQHFASNGRRFKAHNCEIDSRMSALY
jgi:hypothetical protein